jgi:hypothetical protein
LSAKATNLKLKIRSKQVRKLSLAALTALAVIATTPSAHAAKITTAHNECTPKPECLSIHIDGIITIDDFKTFETIAKADKAETVVYLNSDGGNMLGGLLIGMSVKEHGFATYVPADTYCMSMCAAIWIAGKDKYVAPTGKVGFHQPYSEDRRGRKHVDARAVAFMRDYYLKVGVPKPAADYLIAANPNDIYWLNNQLAAGFGINVTTVDETAEQPKTAEQPQEYPQVNRAGKADKLQDKTVTLPKSFIDDLTSKAPSSGKL